MPIREKAPLGAPCWVDLWTSDVAGARKFYSELFGWTAEEPNEEFGGYFIFSREGVPVSGGMGDMGDMKAKNWWTVFLATDDCAKTTKAAVAAGASIASPPMEVADLGTQSMLVDPTGVHLGMWQANNFEGITVLEEPGAPSWFELHSRDYNASLEFYRSVFHWETDVVGDTDDFRYSTMRDPNNPKGMCAGVMDASSFLPEGSQGYWMVYFETPDIHGSIAKLEKLGGSVLFPAQDTPYGWIATVADPFGARFSLRTPPK